MIKAASRVVTFLICSAKFVPYCSVFNPFEFVNQYLWTVLLPRTWLSTKKWYWCEFELFETWNFPVYFCMGFPATRVSEFCTLDGFHHWEHRTTGKSQVRGTSQIGISPSVCSFSESSTIFSHHYQLKPQVFLKNYELCVIFYRVQ